MCYLLRSCALQSAGKERFLLEDDDRTETLGTNIPITLESENAHNMAVNLLIDFKIIIIKKNRFNRKYFFNVLIFLVNIPTYNRQVFYSNHILHKN